MATEKKSDKPETPKVQAEEIQPTVKEVEKDAFDRGMKEGRSLDEQRPAHTPAEKPPLQVGGDEARMVHLPGLISDEFGTSRSEARLQLAMGKVSVDGEPVAPGDMMDLPYEDIVGKTILVEGPNKSFKIDYRG